MSEAIRSFSGGHSISSSAQQQLLQSLMSWQHPGQLLPQVHNPAMHMQGLNQLVGPIDQMPMILTLSSLQDGCHKQPKRQPGLSTQHKCLLPGRGILHLAPLQAAMPIGMCSPGTWYLPKIAWDHVDSITCH